MPPKSSSLRFVYFGTPEFSTLVLEELKKAGYLPVLIVTTPDRPAGRGLALTESSVKKWAVQNAVPTLHPEKFDADVLQKLAETPADLFIVAAYGKILPKAVLEIPKKGALNVHPSLLPKYRGMSPVETQILQDEREIGVSVILMDEKMDHGPILAQERLHISNWPMHRSTLNGLLWKTGGELLAHSIPGFLSGEIAPVEQDHGAATLTKKILKEDGELTETDTDDEKYHKYLAYEGWPGTYFFENGKRIKITKARFENDTFIIERVIPEGGAEMPYQE